jgi:hypothetical protein
LIGRVEHAGPVADQQHRAVASLLEEILRERRGGFLVQVLGRLVQDHDGEIG